MTDAGYWPEYFPDDYWLDEYWPKTTYAPTVATDTILGNYPYTKIEFMPGTDWADISSDVMGSLKFYYGIRGNTPLDRLAVTGLARIYLDNFTTKGLYTPGHTNCSTNFEVNKNLRISMQSDSNAPLYRKFVGKIKKITPDAGEYGEGITTVDVVDWMDDVGRFLIGSMTLQVDKTDGQVVSAIVNSVPNQPVDTDISLGRITFDFANPVGRGGNVPPGIAGIKKAAISALGFGYIKGQASSDGNGGLFVYRDRHDRVGDGIPQAIFDDDPTSSDIVIGDLVAIRDVDKIFNVIKAKVHPISVDSDIRVLWAMDGTPEIGASDGILNITGVYRDSDDGHSVVGADEILHPFADCDYVVRTDSDGHGINLLQNYLIIDTIMGTASDNLIRYWKFADQYDGDTNVIDEIDTNHDGYYDAVGDENGWGQDFNPTGGAQDGRGVALYLGDSDIVASTNCTDVNFEKGSALIWYKAPNTDIWLDTNHLIMDLTVWSPYMVKDLGISSDGGVFGEVWDSNGSIWVKDTDWETADWAMYAMTWNSDGTFTLNINGTDVGTSTSDVNNIAGSPQDIFFGAHSGYWGPGTYAHFALWNDEISTSDFAAIHAAALSTNTYWCSNSATVGGTEVKNSFYNNFSDVGYVTKCQIRGKRIKAYEPVIMEAWGTDSIDAYGERHLPIDLPYQDDPDFGRDAANALLSMLKDPQTVGQRLRFVANQSSDALEKALSLEVGGAIKIKEPQSSIDSDVFFINSASYELIDGRILIVTYDLAPDDYSAFTIDWKQTADFEENDLSDFDTVTAKATDITTVATDAAYAGTYGWKVDIATDITGNYGATDAVYGEFESPNSDTLITYEFYINPDGIIMATDNNFVIANANNGGNYHTHTVLGFNGLYYIQQGYRTDAGGYIATGTRNITDSNWSKIKVHWGAATGIGNNNGYVYLFINDELKESIFDIDNDQATINNIRFGAIDGIDSDTHGDFYMDNCRWGIQG